MRIQTLLRLVVFVVLALFGAPAARAQTGCPTTADTVVVTLTGSITYAPGTVEQFSTSFAQSRNQSLACGTPVSSVISEPSCDPNLFPLPKLLAAQVFEALDKRVGVYDLSCGNLSGTFTIGQAPFALVNGSFTLRRRSSTSVDATITAFVPAGKSALGSFGGGITFKQGIQRDSPGVARGTGSVDILTTAGSSHVSMTTIYQLLGNPTAQFPTPIQLAHDLNYDCTTGTLLSDLCVIKAVPATSPAALLLFPVAILLLSVLVGRRRVRAG